MPQSARIAPLIDGDDVVGTITVIEDVSERVATEKQLRAQIAAAETARVQAEEASRAKDEFLATLSHEIRTPLSAVLGWIHLLKAREPDAATVKRAVEVIERNAKSQLTLITDMLDMARISSGKMRLELADVNMAAIVARRHRRGPAGGRRQEHPAGRRPAARRVAGQRRRRSAAAGDLEHPVERGEVHRRRRHGGGVAARRSRRART